MPAYPRTVSKSVVKYRYKGSLNGQRYISPAIYDTPDDALKAEIEHRAKSRGDTLTSLMEDRLNYLKVHTTSSTYYRDTKRHFDLAKEYWQPDTPVQKITKAMASKLIEKEAHKRLLAGQTQQELNKIIRSLRAFFNYVIDIRDYNMRNPFKGLGLIPVDFKLKYIPTESQVYKLRQNLRGLQQDLFRFVERSGCRVNEGLRLKVDDIQDGTVVLWTHKAKDSNLTPRFDSKTGCS